MGTIDEVPDGYLRARPDAYRAFMTDGDFHALVWRILRDHEAQEIGPGSAVQLAEKLDAEASAAVERIYDRQDRAREAARRPPGPTVAATLFDTPGGDR